MKLAGIRFEPTITLGQVISFIVVLATVIIFVVRTEAIAQDAQTHALQAIPRTEAEARLKNIDENIYALRELITNYVTGHKSTPSKSGNPSTPTR
jgi:hypothetical protein